MKLSGHVARAKACSHSGFTLVEMMVVVAIIGIMTAVAVPSITTAIAHTKLRGASSNLAGLLQNARFDAIKQNRTMTVHFVAKGTIPFAFAKQADDAAPDAAWTGREVQLGAASFQMAVPGGAPPALTNAVLSYTPLDYPNLISFNSRGMPCQYVAPNCTISGFIYYIQDRSDANGWTAVSISPGGRVKQWLWNGSGWVD